MCMYHSLSLSIYIYVYSAHAALFSAICSTQHSRHGNGSARFSTVEIPQPDVRKGDQKQKDEAAELYRLIEERDRRRIEELQALPQCVV